MIRPAKRTALALAVAALIALPTALAAQQSNAPTPFDPVQEQAIRDLVRSYLIDNPEVLVEALTVYRQRQELAAKERQQDSLARVQASLTQDPDSPVVGNPQGDVVVVEFFDYNCPYCRRAADDLLAVVAKDPGVRVVMKEFPILGPGSQFAARAALAAALQGRYEAFHFALMQAQGKKDEGLVMAVARDLGLDLERLRKDMQAPAVDAALRRNFELAETLEINGTPAFVIGDEIFPGAVDQETMLKKVAETRAKAS